MQIKDSLELAAAKKALEKKKETERFEKEIVDNLKVALGRRRVKTKETQKENTNYSSKT